MDSYISYLLSDIQNAHRSVVTGIKREKQISFEDEMEIVENWATKACDEPPTLGLQTGLSVEQFPPIEKLKSEELLQIILAFHEMLASWHIQAEIPEEVPAPFAYTLLINLLNESAWYFPGGMYHFDFCTGFAPDCELKEFCP
ncbi:MAG: hypothetical protein ABJC12_13030, partial [Saprospiraceae bacterium]